MPQKSNILNSRGKNVFWKCPNFENIESILTILLLHQAYSIFTRDDIADFKEVFEYFDKRNRGHITKKQMITTLRSLIPKPKENDIACLMESISFKNTVNFREYLDILHATIESNRKKQIHDKKPRRKRVS